MPLLILQDNNNNPSEQQQQQQQQQHISSGLTHAHQYSTLIATQLLQRCQRKGEDGGASEFRPVLCNLVDDLLLLHLLPQYPASNMLLSAFARCISTQLLRVSGNVVSVSSLETTYTTTAMDVLGKICAHAAQHCAEHRQSPYLQSLPSAKVQYNATATLTTADDEGTCGEEKMSCLCGNTNRGRFSLDCDRCHAWSHGSCVGIATDSFLLPPVWYCHGCVVVVAMEEVQKSMLMRCNVDVDGAASDQRQVLRQLLLQTLYSNHKNKVETSASANVNANAREFHLASWIQELEHNRSDDDDDNSNRDPQHLFARYFLEQWNSTSCTHGNDDNNNITAHHLTQLSRTLSITSSELYTKYYPQILGMLLQIMGGKVVGLRKVAVKALHQIIASDHALMMQPKIRRAIHARFTDDSISVREACVGLVGMVVVTSSSSKSLRNHNNNNTNHVQAYMEPLLGRLSDEGVSVRRRVVKIMRNVLLLEATASGDDKLEDGNNKQAVHTLVCGKLLQCAANPKEEEAVRDSIHDLFVELWFTMTTSSSSSRSNAMEIDTANNGDKQLSAHHARVTRQMSAVIDHDTNKRWITLLLKDLLAESNISGKKKSNSSKMPLQAIQSHCKHLVHALVDQLLNCKHGTESIPVLHTLEVLAEAHHQAQLRDGGNNPIDMSVLRTLLPYIKPNKEDPASVQAVITACVCVIVTLCIRNSDAAVESDISATVVNSSNLSAGQRDALSKEMARDLVQLCYTQQSSVLEKAIECLAALQCEKELNSLSRTFYKYAHSHMDVSVGSAKKVQNNVHRSLAILGAICRHNLHACADASSVAIDQSASVQMEMCPAESFDKGEAFDQHKFVTSCYGLCVEYISHNTNTAIACSAIRALSFLFIAQPRLLLHAEQNHLVSNLLTLKAAQTQPEKVLQMVQQLKCVLEADAHSSRSKVIKAKAGTASKPAGSMPSKSDSKISDQVTGDMDAEASIVGSVLTQHSTALYRLMTRSSHAAIRMVCTDLVGALLHNGLINPLEALPHLLALQGDVHHPGIRNLALKLLLVESERRPDSLRFRVADGVRRAFELQALLKLPCTALIGGGKQGRQNRTCIFSEVFRESGLNKAQRQGLFKSLVAVFEDSFSNGSKFRGSTSSAKKRKRGSGGDTGRNKGMIDLKLMAYTAQMLAHLPYKDISDPVFLIVSLLQPIIDVQGQTVLEKICDVLGENIEDDNTCEAHVMVNKIRSSKKGSNMDDVQLDQLGREAASVSLLLRLKAYLIKSFGISEAKLRSNEGSNNFNTACSNTNSAIFNIDGTCTMEPQAPKAKAKTRGSDQMVALSQFAEFRHLIATVEMDHDNDSDDDGKGVHEVTPVEDEDSEGELVLDE